MELVVESLLFNMVNKPKNYIGNKIVNVYDDKYRVNLYCEFEEDNLVKKRICGSYFVKLVNKSKIEILLSSDKKDTK
jgi:hypothetical protein